jgi:hypothetical protein
MHRPGGNRRTYDYVQAQLDSRGQMDPVQDAIGSNPSTNKPAPSLCDRPLPPPVHWIAGRNKNRGASGRSLRWPGRGQYFTHGKGHRIAWLSLPLVPSDLDLPAMFTAAK